MNLNVKCHSPRSGLAVISLQGEADVYTSPRLKDAIAGQIEGANANVVVDLSGLEFMDSTGLGVLVGGRRRALDAGGTLKIVCQAPRLLRLFEKTSLDKVFEIYPTESDALASL